MKNWQRVSSFGFFTDVYEADRHQLRLWQKDTEHLWQLMNDETCKEVKATEYYAPDEVEEAQAWASRLIDGEPEFPADGVDLVAPDLGASIDADIKRELQKPDGDGWTKYTGGGCPVNHGTKIIIRNQAGEEFPNSVNVAGFFAWGKPNFQVTHYKVIEEPKQEELGLIDEMGVIGILVQMVHDNSTLNGNERLAALAWLQLKEDELP